MAGRARRQIDTIQAFWDSSALIPLCREEALTSKATDLYRKYRVAVWWATPVEIASALARLSRMGHIDSAESIAASHVANSLGDQWSFIAPSSDTRDRAVRLVARFALRAADALQLAAALQWCEDQPVKRIFLTADDKLREAARLSGFDTSEL